MQAEGMSSLVSVLKVKPAHGPKDACKQHMLSSAPRIIHLLILGQKGVPVRRNPEEMCFLPSVVTVPLTHLE